MEVSRSIGIGIVMMIPSFVGAGAMWELFESWGPVIAYIALFILIYGAILFKGHYSDN